MYPDNYSTTRVLIEVWHTATLCPKGFPAWNAPLDQCDTEYQYGYPGIFILYPVYCTHTVRISSGYTQVTFECKKTRVIVSCRQHIILYPGYSTHLWYKLYSIRNRQEIFRADRFNTVPVIIIEIIFEDDAMPPTFGDGTTRWLRWLRLR